MNIFKQFYVWLRWGVIRSNVTDITADTICEIEYTDRDGQIIGYWAYGEFCLFMPYKGQYPWAENR